MFYTHNKEGAPAYACSSGRVVAVARRWHFMQASSLAGL